jgi:hypothetical protein
MKKLLVLMMVLGIASAANAALLISVDGVVDPPDSSIEIMESDWVTLDIWGDGVQPGGMFLLGLAVDAQGPASLDISGAQILYVGNANTDPWIFDDPDTAAYLGLQNMFVALELVDIPAPPTLPNPLEGTLVDGIRLHCDGPGEVTILLMDGEGTILDTQVIHQIVPEPMTLGLLGLGGLFLRRRK